MPGLADTVHEFERITRAGIGCVFESFAALEQATHGRVPTLDPVRDTF